MERSPDDQAVNPPPAAGVRVDWLEMPAQVRAAVEGWLGSPVSSATSQPGGFSPGVAARIQTADGRRFFIKAVGADANPLSPQMHRREAEIVVALPPEASVPRLLWTYDEGEDGWIAMLFEDGAGRQPAVPWRPDELKQVLAALAELTETLTPSPLASGSIERVADWEIVTRGWWRQLLANPSAMLDPWSRRHLAALAELGAGAPAAAAGQTLLHLDLRADNMLLTPERVLIVDWPHARVGAAWIDVVFFAPSVAMQGGPQPEELLARHPAARAADPGAITAMVAAIAGFFTYQALQPPPPGLPTVRAFQAAQGEVARRWLAERTGWT